MAHNDLSGSNFQCEKFTPLTTTHRGKSTNNQMDIQTPIFESFTNYTKIQIYSQNYHSNFLVIYNKIN